MSRNRHVVVDVKPASQQDWVIVALGDEDTEDPDLSEIETYLLSRTEAQDLYDRLGSWLNS